MTDARVFERYDGGHCYLRAFWDDSGCVQLVRCPERLSIHDLVALAAWAQDQIGEPPSQIKEGDFVRVTASPQELFELGIMRDTAEAISGQVFKVHEVGAYPRDPKKTMVYIGGKDRHLWVLDVNVKKVSSSAGGQITTKQSR